jgi:plasmid stabilization system protein ParE
MKVAFGRRAVTQINRAFDHIAEDNPAAARGFMTRIELLASLLATRPGIGRTTSKEGVQVIGTLPYRYLMFYKVLPERDEVRILRLRHMRRRDALDVRGL